MTIREWAKSATRLRSEGRSLFFLPIRGPTLAGSTIGFMAKRMKYALYAAG